MFHKPRMLLFTSSNILILKALGMPLPTATKLFIVDSLNRLMQVVKIINKFSKKFAKLSQLGQGSGLTLAPVAGALHSFVDNSKIMPGALLLILRRPAPTNPLDFDLFVKDSTYWYTKFVDYLKGDFLYLFIYDPLHIPYLLVQYIPLILIMNFAEGFKQINTCFDINICTSYAIEFHDFYVVIGAWLSPTELEKVGNIVHIDLSDVAKIGNPFFCSKPLDANICAAERLQPIQLIKASPNIDKAFDTMIIEFLSSYSYLAPFSSSLNGFSYAWFPIPSSNLLPLIANVLKDITVERLWVLSPIDNFAERGSIDADRLWISILKRLTGARYTKVVTDLA